MISKDTMIPVPAQLLQDLIWGVELDSAGNPDPSECLKANLRHCEELQKYLEVLHSDDDKEFVLEDFNNVEFVNFGAKR